MKNIGDFVGGYQLTAHVVHIALIPVSLSPYWRRFCCRRTILPSLLSVSILPPQGLPGGGSGGDGGL